ncbi:zinc finger HIT domain-containing protein 3-like [Anolis carolinensis]|uniref:zinc finger HIT domain-containing protein 3-like n=1 Tax=Anolis carolinensis TaxID=28377 RepID=UPI002F2B2818
MATEEGVGKVMLRPIDDAATSVTRGVSAHAAARDPLGFAAALWPQEGTAGREGGRPVTQDWRERRTRRRLETLVSISSGGSFAVDDILTEDDEGDKVPLHKLQRLGGSVELGGLLRNPHLGHLLLRVDGAADKSALLRESMQEPLFAEFADCCLRIVEPPPAEEEQGDPVLTFSGHNSYQS